MLRSLVNRVVLATIASLLPAVASPCYGKDLPIDSTSPAAYHTLVVIEEDLPPIPHTDPAGLYHPPMAVADTPWLPPPPERLAGPITPEEYKARRTAVAELMKDGVLLVIGAPAPPADYLEFNQSSDFRYLTGIMEPDAALLMVKSGGELYELLLVQPRDPSRELWEGPRLGPDGATALTGVKARSNDALPAVVDSLLSIHRRLYTVTEIRDRRYGTGLLSPEQQILLNILRRHPEAEHTSVRQHVRRLRATKSETEIDLLRRAVYITVLAHRNVLRLVEPGMSEFEVQAVIEAVFRRHGAESTGFESIVGSGPNSTTLHYNVNDRFMVCGDMLLMDVGASYRGYTADITRTIPVNGRFSEEQRGVYEVVLQAQKAAEQLIDAGARWGTLHEAASSAIAQGLADLGLIDDPEATYDCGPDGQRCPQSRLFFMHGLGHGIGLDVHDPVLTGDDVLEYGSVFTIEPGIYVRADALDYIPDTPYNRRMRQRLLPVVSRFQDIGVRIEDNYLITRDGWERLSDGAPREVSEIESMLATPRTDKLIRVPEVLQWYHQTRAKAGSDSFR